MRASGEVGQLNTIAVITKDRPEALKRGLNSYIENALLFKHNPDIVVADDSQKGADENQKILTELAQSHNINIFYLGFREKEALIKSLSETSGIDKTIIEFAVLDSQNTQFTPGANRNSLLLELAGTPFLCVDDDSVCNIGVAASYDSASTLLLTRKNLTEILPFKDLKQCSGSVKKGDFDLLGQHRKWLGKTLDECLKESVYSKEENFPSQKDSQVRMTWTGFYGDSGVKHSNYLLSNSSVNRDVLFKDEQTYRENLMSRQVRFSTPSTVLSFGNYTHSMVQAFDNSGLLPPFIPVYRGEDHGFAQLTQICLDDFLNCSLPLVVEHSPIPSRTNSFDDRFEGVKRLDFIIFFRFCISAFKPNVNFSKNDQFRFLGNYLQELGMRNLEGFKDFIQLTSTSYLQFQISKMISMLEAFPDGPPFWKSDIEKIMDILEDRLMSGDSISPHDVKGESGEEKVSFGQTLIYEMGLLIEAWPKIYSTALNLRKTEMRFARKLG